MRRLEWTLQASILATLALLAFGWTLVRVDAPWPAAAVVIGCGAFWHFAIRMLARAHGRAAQISIAAGALSAVVYVPSLLVEYVGRTVNNTILLGVMFALWLIGGVLVGVLSGRLRDAVVSATVSAQIAALASVITMFSSYYLLRGSALQDVFFRTEGTYDDFARSGLHDFGRFVVEDMFGGTFFHFVLGTLFGLAAGIVSGAIVAGVKWVRGRPRAGRHAASQALD